MAYNVIPKTEPEMRAQSRHMTAANEVIRLYSYLTDKVPSVTDPIAMDPKQKSKLKILRELKGYMTINDMVNGAKLDKLKLDYITILMNLRVIEQPKEDTNIKKNVNNLSSPKCLLVVKNKQKISRNERCEATGKKFKNCCGAL